MPRHPAVGAPCQCQYFRYCNCLEKKSNKVFLLENIQDVAETLAEVMAVCGIQKAKAKATIDITKDALVRYDHVHEHIDTLLRKRMRKDHFMCEMGKMCGLTRSEAHLAYAIVKRGFKAFYFGTDVYGLPNAFFESHQGHTAQCLWAHAAKKTAFIYSYLVGLRSEKQEAYHSRVRDIYYHLYDRIKNRASTFFTTWQCECLRCKKQHSGNKNLSKSLKKLPGGKKKEAKESKRRSKLLNLLGVKESELIQILLHKNDKKPHLNETPKSTSKLLPPPRKTCNCPKLICDCKDNIGKDLFIDDCGIGPFHCRWHRTTHVCLYEQDITNLYVPEKIQECPSCDSCEGEDILCICEDECDCMFSDDSDIEEEDLIEGMEELPEEEFSFPSTLEPLMPATERYPHPSFGGCRVLKIPCDDNAVNEISQRVQMSNVQEQMEVHQIFRRTMEPAKTSMAEKTMPTMEMLNKKPSSTLPASTTPARILPSSILPSNNLPSSTLPVMPSALRKPSAILTPTKQPNNVAPKDKEPTSTAPNIEQREMLKDILGGIF